MNRYCSRIAIVLMGAFLTSTAQANPVVSFGVQGGQPATETLGGVTVRPADGVDVANGDIAFGELPASEDLDALHIRDDGTVLFSTTTIVFIGGTSFLAGDVAAWDGVSYSLVLDSGLFGATENVDAVSELPNGNLLISTSTAATLFGLAFADGDVVEVDVAGGTASLFMGLDEAALFTGANQNIDALHYDRGNGHLLLSVLADGPGTIGGYDVSGQGASADLIELDLSSGVSGSLRLEGGALYDGSTRQLDAAFLIVECGDGIDNDGDTLTDLLDDPGCDSADDSSEQSPVLACDDGHDNDGDGASDFPNDIGCFSPTWTESPECSDGVNNDPGQDGLMDFDGGLSIHGVAVTAPDPQCPNPWKNRESTSCGLGFEVAPFLLGAAWLMRRRRAGSAG